MDVIRRLQYAGLEVGSRSRKKSGSARRVRLYHCHSVASNFAGARCHTCGAGKASLIIEKREQATVEPPRSVPNRLEACYVNVGVQTCAYNSSLSSS